MVVTGGFTLVEVWTGIVAVVVGALDVVVAAVVEGAVVAAVVVATGADVAVVEVLELQPVMIKANIKRTTRGTRNLFITTSFFSLHYLHIS